MGKRETLYLINREPSNLGMLLRTIVEWHSNPVVNHKERKSTVRQLRVIEDLEQSDMVCVDTQFLAKFANQRNLGRLAGLNVAPENVPNVWS